MWLKCEERDSGQKPFRFNNCWLEYKVFLSFVKDCWDNFHIEGWKGFMLKEKLNLLKEHLRKWNKEVKGAILTFF